MTNSSLAVIAREAAATANKDVSAESTADPQKHTPDQAAISAALSSGREAGAKAERERCKEILTAEAAKGRSDLAAYFAFDTDMPAATAIAALAKAPMAETSNSFVETMRSDPNPDVGTGVVASTQSAAIPTLAEMAAARYGVSK